MSRRSREVSNERDFGHGVNWTRVDYLTILSLVGVVVFVFWRLAFTELIIARGDILTYFYPYRDFASAAVRLGRVPLWNPFLFMGVPFLANSQAGFFYPLNLALAWLSVERMVNASIVLHVALATIGAFSWGRDGLRLGRPGAWLTGVCYGLGGYYVAQVEHLNQVHVLAWLPWLLWLYGRRVPTGGSPNYRERQLWKRIAGLGVVFALQFSAGHIQAVFICLVGLSAYAIFPVIWGVVQRQSSWRQLTQPVIVVSASALLGGALTAVQLLPTMELAALSIRSGGLPYKEAVSFSLRPELVGRAILPGWGSTLFPEFVAYVGVIGLGLATAGMAANWRGGLAKLSDVGMPVVGFRGSEGAFVARRGPLCLVVLGLFLALGGFNPVYYLLVKLVPGFGSFRAPARWLALYAVGIAGLAGMGFDGLIASVEARHSQNRPHSSNGRWSAFWTSWLAVAAFVSGSVILGVLIGRNQDPDLAPPLEYRSVIAWLVAALTFSGIARLSRVSQSPSAGRLVGLLLIAAVTVELSGSSTFLPLNRATSPDGLTSLRPAVAHLLAEARSVTSGPPYRFLSMSHTFFDPGDKLEIEMRLQQQLSDDAVYDFVVATKQKEVLVPNFPLYYRLPTVDGYDGGVLPLRRFVTLETLYMPEGKAAIDGRLREYLQTVPDGRWLSLFNVRYIITDKVGDAWFDDVFYDLQMGGTFALGEEASVGYIPPMPATSVGIVYQAEGAAEGTPLADLKIAFADGSEVSLPLVAGLAGTGDRAARLQWDRVATPSEVTVRGRWEQGDVTVRGLSLIDERTHVFRPLLISDRGHYRVVHSGDVKIYENLDVLPRAIFVPHAVAVPGDEAAIALMRDAAFDPTISVVLASNEVIGQGSSAAKEMSRANPRFSSDLKSEVDLVVYEPEHIVASVTAPSEGWVLLTDTWYPGWEATVDAEPVPIERANVLFRAIPVPPGEHQVELHYRPATFRSGLLISLCTWGLLALGAAWVGLSRRGS